MGVTNFQSVVSAQAIGTADIEKLTQALDKQSTALDNLGKKAEQVKPPAWEKFAAGVKEGIQNPLQAAGNAAESLLKGLGPMGGAVTATAGVLALAGKAGWDAARSLGEYADALMDTAVRTGLTNKEVSQFSFAMKRAGGDISSVEAMMRKLSQGLADSSEQGKAAREGLLKLGVHARDAYGQMRPMSEIMLQLSERFRAMPDTVNRNAIAVQILGRSALEALPDFMELSEGVRIARERGMGPKDEDLLRWDAYRKQIVEAEYAWEKLKRRLKDPIAGIVMVSIKGPAALKKWIEESGLPEWIRRQTGEPNPAGGIDLAEVQRGNVVSMGRHVAGKFDVADQNWESATSRFYGTKEGVQYRLQEAKGKATEARGAYFALSDQQVTLAEERRLHDAWQDAEKHLERLKAQEEALNEAEKQRKDTIAAIDALQARANETGVAGMEKVRAELDNWLIKFPVVGKELEHVNALFAEIWSTEQVKEADKLIDEFDKLMEKAGELPNWLKVRAGQGESLGLWAQKEWMSARTQKEGIGAGLQGSPEWMAGFQRNAAAMRDINFQSRMGTAGMLSERDLRMSELSFGPNQEVASANASYAIRLGHANQLYETEKIHAGEVAAREKTDAERTWKLAEELAKAKDGWDKARMFADIEHELKIAELQRRRLDELRNRAGEFFDAMLQGPKGIQRFFTDFVKSQARTIFQNIIVEQAKGISPYLGSASKYLKGTLLGTDPLKSAGMRLQVAAAELIGAARVLAMSPSGGGGGWVNATRAAGMYSDARWYGQGSGETEFEGTGLPGGINGDWGGETNNPSNTSGIWPGGTLSKPGVKYGMAGIGVGLGAYGAVTSPSTRGKLSSIGGGLMSAGAVIPGPAGWIVMGAGAVTSLASMLFGDPKEDRRKELERSQQARAFSDPMGRAYESDLYGRSIDYDYRGGMRVYNDYRSYSAIDAPSFVEWGKRNSAAIAEVTTAAMSSGNAEDMVGTLRQVL